MLFFSLVLTLVIGFVLHKTIGFRVTAEEEQAGVDGSEHAETGYDLGSFWRRSLRRVIWRLSSAADRGRYQP